MNARRLMFFNRKKPKTPRGFPRRKTEKFNFVRLSAHPNPSRIKVRKSGPYLDQHSMLYGERGYDTGIDGSMRTKDPWTPTKHSMT